MCYLPVEGVKHTLPCARLSTCTDTAAFHCGDSHPEVGVLIGEGGP